MKRYRVTANRFASIIAAVSTAAMLSFNGCRQQPHLNTPAEDVAEGKVLSVKYCSSCHRYPEAKLLDKATWEQGVLPKMAWQLGIQEEMGQYYMDLHSAITLPDWQKIVAYYKNAAPEKLSIPKADAVTDWAMFTLKKPALRKTTDPAMTTMVKLNPVNGTIYSGDAKGQVLSWDAHLKSKVVAQLSSAVSDVTFQGGYVPSAVFSCLGILPPNDELKGSIELLRLGAMSTPKKLLDSLPRPVFVISDNFNRDARPDYVIGGYGNTKGALLLAERQPDGEFKKKVIRAVPGAIQAVVEDFNNDGWPDIMCLFAQADEGIWVFLNDHKGGFSTKNVLRFPPVYGSNSFQLVDVNNDGRKDIVYTCGDNNDYSGILKPYHGVYIFTNQGGVNFKQTCFYHINGASKVMAADFNGDGKKDLVVTAFFADFKNQPGEGLTYFEQQSPNKFKATRIPVNKEGRWLAMEVADVDSNGMPDIVLGNFTIFGDKLVNQKDFKPDWNMTQPLIYLLNKNSKKL